MAPVRPTCELNPMNNHSEILNRPQAVTMPMAAPNNRSAILWCLLALWVANLALFFVYFVKLGWLEWH